MAITPGAGYQQDPNNANGVIPVGAAPAAPVQTYQTPVDPNTPGSPTYNPTGGAPINRSITPGSGADAAQTYLDTFQAPQSADQIAEGKRQSAQALIDSTNKTYDDQVAQEKLAGQGRLDRNNSTNVLSGLMGSTEAVRTTNEVSGANDKAIQAVNNQRAAALQGIYSKISDQAATEAEQQKQDATKSAEDILARRKDVATQAISSITDMAKTGMVNFDSFKNSPQNAQVYQHALDSVGGSEDALRAIFAINRPQDQLVGSPQRVGDHFIQGYSSVDPATGKTTVRYDTIAIPGGLPASYSTFQKMGDNLVAIPDGWNGDTSQLKTIAGTPSQSDILDQQYKRAQISNIQANTDKTRSEMNGASTPTGYNGEFGATIDLAANQGGTNAQRAQTKNTIQTFIAQKDYPSAYAAIADATAKGLKGTAATNFQQQQNSLGVLDGLQTAMKAYSDAGGNTNIFKGSVDQVQNKIGALMTDPKYASLAVQMTAAFQNYRLQMTGAAFSPAESAEYAAILPSQGNTLDLNLTKLTGAKNYLNSSVESSIKSVVGQGGVEIKKYAEGAQPSSQSTDTSGPAQGTDGASYGFPGYHSDGKQWVLN